MNFEIEDLFRFFVGLTTALFGWIIYWAGMNASGMILGFFFGASVSLIILSLLGIQTGLLIIACIAGILGGVFGKFVVREFHYVMVFMLGLSITVMLVRFSFPGLLPSLIQRTSNQDLMNLNPNLITLIVGVIGGFLAIAFRDFILILSTAGIGIYLMRESLTEAPSDLIVGGAFILAVILQDGIVRYFRLRRRPQKESET